jgi:hypothetical protein
MEPPLSADALLLAFVHLDTRSLCRAGQTCRTWLLLARDDSLWRGTGRVDVADGSSWEACEAWQRRWTPEAVAAYGRYVTAWVLRNGDWGTWPWETLEGLAQLTSLSISRRDLLHLYASADALSHLETLFVAGGLNEAFRPTERSVFPRITRIAVGCGSDAVDDIFHQQYPNLQLYACFGFVPDRPVGTVWHYGDRLDVAAALDWARTAWARLGDEKQLMRFDVFTACPHEQIVSQRYDGRATFFNLDATPKMASS